MDGKSLRTLSPAQWRRMKAGMRFINEIGSRPGSIRCVVAAGE